MRFNPGVLRLHRMLPGYDRSPYVADHERGDSKHSTRGDHGWPNGVGSDFDGMDQFGIWLQDNSNIFDYNSSGSNEMKPHHTLLDDSVPGAGWSVG